MGTSQPAASRKLGTMSCMSRRGPIYRERTSEWASLNSLATTVGGMASTHRRETISESVNSDCRPIDPDRSSKWGNTSIVAKWSLGQVTTDRRSSDPRDHGPTRPNQDVSMIFFMPPCLVLRYLASMAVLHVTYKHDPRTLRRIMMVFTESSQLIHWARLGL